jgi:hypothetical protein
MHLKISFENFLSKKKKSWSKWAKTKHHQSFRVNAEVTLVIPDRHEVRNRL